MGVSKKTVKIEAYVDTDVLGWTNKYGEGEYFTKRVYEVDFIEKVHQDALD